MTDVAPFVVACLEADPGYVPPFQDSPNQWTIGLRYQHAANTNACGAPPDTLLLGGAAYDLKADDHLRQAVTRIADRVRSWACVGRLLAMPSPLAGFSKELVEC